MADQNFNRTISIYVDTGAAQVAYDKLAATQEKLKTQVQEYIDKGKDIPEKLTKQLDGVTEALDRQSKKLSGELSPSYKDLTSTVTKLTQEVSRMSAQDAGFEKKTKELHEAREQADQYKTSVLGIAGAMTKGKEHGSGFIGTLKGIAAGFGLEQVVARAGELVKDFFADSVKEALEVEETQAQLKTSLENVGRVDALDKLNKQAEEYSKRFSYLYVPEITKVQNKLVTFGHLSTSEINKLLPVIINYSAKTKKSMEESTEVFLKAMEGNARGFKEIGVNIEKGGTVAQNYGIIMDKVARRVDGAADTFQKSGAGGIAAFQKSLKELEENIGKYILPTLTKLMNAASWVMGVIKDMTAGHEDHIAALKKEQVGLNENLTALQNTNLTASARKKLIDDTNKKYSEYLPNLLTEKSTLEDIKKAQIAGNNAMLKKIFLMSAEKELAPILEAQMKAYEELADVQIRYAKITSTMSGKAKENMEKEGKQYEAIENKKIEDSNKAIKQIQDKYEVMFKNIGVSAQEFKNMLSGTTTADNTALNGDAANKELEAQLEAYKEFAKHLEDLKNEAYNKTLSANDKEIADLDDKYHKEMDQLDKFLLDGVIKEKEYNKQNAVISKAYTDEFEALKAKQLKAATEKEYETAVKAVTATFEATRELNAKRLRDGEISEREYNQRLALLDQVELSAKIDLANKYKTSIEKAKDDIVKYNKEADDKATKDFLAELAKRKAAEQAMLNYEKEAAKTRAQIAGTEGKDETNQKLAELNAWFAEEAAKYEGQEDVLTKLTADYQAKRDKIIADGFKKTLQDVAKDIQKFGSALTGALDGIFKIMGQHEDHALKAAQNANKSKIKSYDEQLKHRQISQAQHDKLVEAANAEMARKEEEARKKKFEREKALGIVKATINMATGIMTAVAENPITGGQPGSAIAALMGGIEIGVIASQKYEHGTPEFVGGSSHSAGGNAIIDRRTGREVGEMERGEAIIPKDARDANPALIRHLLGPGRKQNLLNTLRPVVPLDTHRNLANIEHSNNPRSEGGSGSSGTHMHDESVGLLREIHSTLTQHTALHKANADKPPLSLHHIQEAERKQAFILSQKM